MLGGVSHSSLEEHKVSSGPAGVKDRVLGGVKGSGYFLSLYVAVYHSIHMYKVWLGEHSAPAPTPVTHLALWPCTATLPSSFELVTHVWHVYKLTHLHKGKYHNRTHEIKKVIADLQPGGCVCVCKGLQWLWGATAAEPEGHRASFWTVAKLKRAERHVCFHRYCM